MNYEEKREARKRGEEYLKGGLTGCVMLPINALVAIAVVFLLYLLVTGQFF
jgi:hypothetical protein